MSISDEVCMECHNQAGQTYKLSNGDTLDLYVPAEDYHKSIHGQLGYACVQCHTSVGNYPHPNFDASFPREATLKLNQACKRCHIDEYEKAQDSVHAAFLSGGNLNAAVCTDCHTAHDVRQLKDPKTGKLLPDARVWIPTTCARCHSAIYEKYKESVHGSALIGEGNPDVPTCIDCHGVHNIEDPTTTYFRLNSPQMCANCHTDPNVVGKYNLSTDVLSTYVADFHGTTVALFEKQSPDAETNKPVCFDCHGVHDIARTDDPEKGIQLRANLLKRCQVCHPDATDSFPASWTSHYIPSVDKNPLIYYVNLFYKFLIPGVLGGMGLLVVMDFGRANLNRYRARKRRHEEHEIHEKDETGESHVEAAEAEISAASPTAEEVEETTPVEEAETAEEQEVFVERENGGAVPPDDAVETDTSGEQESDAPDTETE
jgi:nitrate/TMAO reductase-like tetraheme cytochrome c subunit